MESNPEKRPLPFEMRIHKFKEIVIPKRTLAEKFNYWEIKDDQLLIGYHSQKETFGEVSLGMLVPSFGSKKYSLVINPEVDSLVFKKILPTVTEDMKKNNIDIVEVLSESMAKAA
ncbi:MAG: hypothetical protein ACOZBH_00410 [Patescibacteria group bacterium]